MALFILFRGTLQFLTFRVNSGVRFAFSAMRKEGQKPISHAVLPVSPKRNGESLNKFYIMWNKK